jgi:hypothetical protein
LGAIDKPCKKGVTKVEINTRVEIIYMKNAFGTVRNIRGDDDGVALYDIEMEEPTEKRYIAARLEEIRVARPKLTFPTVHLNDTSKMSWLAQYRKAFDAINQAIDAMKEIEINGRHYYWRDRPGRRPTIYKNKYLGRLQELYDIKEELGQIALEISTQGDLK